MLLEKEHDHFGEINQDRQRIEQELKHIRDKHGKKKEEVDTQMRQSKKSFLKSNESFTFVVLKLWTHRRNEMFSNVEYNI